MSDFHTYAYTHAAYFKQHGRKILYKKGQLLVRREENSPWMFFIERGFVKMMFTNENGDERILGFGMPGMTTAQSGSFYSLPHIELEYEAYTDCTVWRAPRDEFLRAMTTDIELFRDWHERILQNHNMLVERILYAGEKDPHTRVVGWLLAMGRYYSLAQPDGSTMIEIPMTQDIMASFTHLSRESINKIIRDLRTRELITINKRIVTIPSIEKLRTELHAS